MAYSIRCFRVFLVVKNKIVFRVCNIYPNILNAYFFGKEIKIFTKHQIFNLVFILCLLKRKIYIKNEFPLLA